MRLLDRYLIREWLFPFLICLTGFMVLWIAFDLINDLDEFEGLDVAEIARFYLMTLPEHFFVVMPVALLLSLLYAINQHSRYHEFIAIRNAGVGMFRMSAPYLLIGILLSVGLYSSNEYWLPTGLRQGKAIRDGQETPLDSGWLTDVKFRNDKAKRNWQIPAFNPTTGELRAVGNNPILIEWKWDDTQPERVIMAPAGRWEDGGWTFNMAKGMDDQVILIKDYAPTEGFPETQPITQHESLRMGEFNESPIQIEGELKIAPLFDKRAHKRWSVSLAEIDGYRRIHPNIAQEKKAILDAQYQARLAEPLTCLIVVMIAIPFAAPSGRRNAAAGVAAGIVVCLAFFMVQQMSMAFVGQYSAHIAAWAPHAIFGGISAWQITKVR